MKSHHFKLVLDNLNDFNEMMEIRHVHLMLVFSRSSPPRFLSSHKVSSQRVNIQSLLVRLPKPQCQSGAASINTDVDFQSMFI